MTFDKTDYFLTCIAIGATRTVQWQEDIGTLTLAELWYRLPWILEQIRNYHTTQNSLQCATEVIQKVLSPFNCSADGPLLTGENKELVKTLEPRISFSVIPSTRAYEDDIQVSFPRSTCRQNM